MPPNSTRRTSVCIWSTVRREVRVSTQAAIERTTSRAW